MEAWELSESKRVHGGLTFIFSQVSLAAEREDFLTGPTSSDC